jgi:alkanesulfonate monooxygenase SsuD/methylene tetrahydromethanopterin reductase-like flavin-dependent oxidoreductase (luciferase family)
MTMEFGIFHGAHVPEQPTDEAWRKAEHAKLMDEITVGITGDRTGFKYSWATEHHFLEQYSHLSANEVFLSFLAAKTERIHVGTGIMNITAPVNHPVRNAERAAMLDNLTEGRFELGVGRGSSSTEFEGFGIPDGDTTRDMFDEALPQLVRMWKEREYSYEGESFSVPPRDVLPKPYTNHPPLWVACGSPATFAKAGQLGLGALCFSMGAPETLEPLVTAYKKAIAECDNPVGDFVNDNIACVSRLFCYEDEQKAYEVGANAGSSFFQSLVFKWLDSIPKPPGVPVWPDLLPEPSPRDIQKGAERGMLVAGNPDQCGAAVQQYVDIGVDQIIFGMLGNNLPVEAAIESMELFGEQVLPKFDTDPVHSTTRHREAAGF